MLACMAGFRRGIPLINLDQHSSVPLRFVFQLSDKLTPSHIADRFCKAVVLDHVLDCQTLHADHLVFVNDAGGELVLIVMSTIIDTGMHTGDFEACFLSVLRSLLFLGMPTLSFCQPLLIHSKEFWVSDTLTSGEDDHRLQPQVKSNHLRRDFQWLDRLFNQDGDKVAVRAILGDRDRTGFSTFGKISMEVNIQGSIHLRKSDMYSIPLEGVGCIGSRLAMLLFLEVGILSPSLKEVLEGSIQVSEGLLNGDGRDISQPGVLLLEIREHSSKIVVEELFPVFPIGDCAGMESPIVDEASTTKRLSKDDPLLNSRIEPILICSFRLAHRLFVFLMFLDVLFHGGQNLPIQRAIVALCNLFQLFQDLSGKPQCECFYIVFHSTIIQSNWLNVNGYDTPVPKPQTRNAPYIPVSEDRGFTARVDKY